MKRLLIPFLIVCMLFSGCAKTEQPEKEHPEKEQFTATFLELFDTVTTIVGRDVDKESFTVKAQAIRDDLEYYHRLFDIYNDYEGIANLKTVNDHAGVSAVTVERVVIDLLLDCKRYYYLTEGRVNVAMGGVLTLWHEARSDGIRDPLNAQLPDVEQLKKAAEHISLESVIINEAQSTVYIEDPNVCLDVGAVAKGWATQQVAKNAPRGMLISVGGNVCATGPKTEEGSPWVIGIQNPDDVNTNLHAVYLTKGAVVTSGDYQRTYTVDGNQYHHIIDPKTQMPATRWRSVSIICEDSGLADALSTGLFLMDLEEGKCLAEQCGAEVLWVDHEKNEFMTPGLKTQLRN